MPILVDGDTTLFESTVILAYLEKIRPEPPMLPGLPPARAFARITGSVCDTQYEAVNWGFGEILWFGRATGALADRLRAEAAAQTAVLQDWLSARLGTADWFGSDRFSWPHATLASALAAD